MTRKIVAALSCVAMLASCGGGGDSDNAVAANSGNTGVDNGVPEFSQAAGTQLVWSKKFTRGDNTILDGAQGLHVTVDDKGIAVASWDSPTPGELMVASTDISGAWMPAKLLSREEDLTYPYVHRSNSAGQRVLVIGKSFRSGSAYPYGAYFYSPATGWSDEVPLTREIAGWKSEGSDLAVDDDGTALITVFGYDSLTGPWDATTPAEVYRLSPDGAKPIGVQTVSMSSAGRPMLPGHTTFTAAVFAMPPQNSSGAKHEGYFFWRELGTGYSSLSVSGAVLAARPLFTVDARNINMTPMPLVGGIDYCQSRSIHAKASGKYTAIAIWQQTSATGQCQLMATRLNQFPWQVQTDVINADAASLGVQSYMKLLMDESGNALMIWGNPVTAVYQWSQSLAGGAWSPPADLASSLGINARSMTQPPAIAMSKAGDAVAAIVLRPVGANSNIDLQISYARFSFGAGWGSSTVIGEGYSVSDIDPDVDINVHGKATILYDVRPSCSYLSTECTAASVYAYNL